MNVAEKFKIKKEIAALIKNLAEGELTIPNKFKIKKDIAGLVKRLGGEAPASPKGSGNEKLETLKAGGYNSVTPTSFILILKELIDAGVELEELKEPAVRYIEYNSSERHPGGAAFDSADMLEGMEGLFADGGDTPLDFRQFPQRSGPPSPGIYFGPLPRTGPDSEGMDLEELRKARLATIFFDGPISAPSLYREATNTIADATSNRTIKLIINTGGGNTMTAQQISDALIKTEARKTVAEIHNAHSAGAIIAFSCDKIVVNPQSTVMIHGASINGAGGKINSLRNHFTFTEQYFDEWFKNLFLGFITEDEMSDLKKGCDLWIKGKEITQRLQGWTPLRKRMS